MNGRFQMQGIKKLDFVDRDKCTPVLLRFSLAGNLEKHLCPSMGPNSGSVAADSEAGVSVPEFGRSTYRPARLFVLPRRTDKTLAD
jgi:hypothetical protein